VAVMKSKIEHKADVARTPHNTRELHRARTTDSDVAGQTIVDARLHRLLRVRPRARRHTRGVPRTLCVPVFGYMGAPGVALMPIGLAGGPVRPLGFCTAVVLRPSRRQPRHV
jgi:hypothetical protein